MNKVLADVCEFVSGRIDIDELTFGNYISTENMLPNKEGITSARKLPTVKTTQKFETGDILVSNIRPYFKKIWMADKIGGCSNDVLVFRVKSGYSPKFLYYVLSDDKFFEYSTASAKGTKMPRGDKTAIMQYEVPDLSIDV